MKKTPLERVARLDELENEKLNGGQYVVPLSQECTTARRRRTDDRVE